MWATRRAVGRKLFFCYPTTGTASQGFFDYVPPNLTEAALIHSRSAVDLEDVLSGEPADGGRLVDRLITMGALAAWDAPVTVCTVDTVLGLIQNNRRGLFSFPSLANAAFVFDEIHQYDDQLFGALLRFIAAVPGVPMLLMTASLPRDRLHTLEDVLHEVGDELSVIDGPADLEALERYCVRTDSVADTWSETTVAVGAGRRVLWVANTVDRAVSLAQEAERRGLPTLLYHSRYQYQHRLGHHRVVVDAFSGARKRGVVAVTTQVCEVSLDLSADLLVTELAPVPALIQRLGRLNRRVKPGEHIHPAPAIVTEPPTHEPYTTEELVTARLWLGKVSDRPVSQTALTRAFEDVVSQVAAPVARVRSAWLDCGPFATAAAVREDGTTVPVVRAEDLASLRGLPEGRLAREVVRRTIPMPLARVANAVGMWPRRSGSLVAPAGTMDYSERYGGKWR
jgi:CRISPR-associated endonuclease/helicase Cas3